MGTVVGKAGAVYAVTAGAASTAFSNQAMTVAADQKTCTITNKTYQWWDDTVAPTIQTSPDNTTWTTAAPSTYTVQYVGGVVVFGTALAGGTYVRASAGNYWPVSQIAGGHEWTMEIDAPMLDSTEFGDLWKTFTPGISAGKGSIKRYWEDGYFLGQAAVRMILALYVDYSGDERYAGYGYVAKDQIDSKVESLVAESVDFTFTGQVYYLSA